MITNRELTMDDYLSMLRRRVKVIIVPALFAPLVGCMVSYTFTPKYTSQATILVESQKVPEKHGGAGGDRGSDRAHGHVGARDAEPRAICGRWWRSFSPAKNPQEVGAIMDDIRHEDDGRAGSAGPVGDRLRHGEDRPSRAPVRCRDSFWTTPDQDPREAQQICNELTTILVDENLKSEQARPRAPATC